MTRPGPLLSAALAVLVTPAAAAMPGGTTPGPVVQPAADTAPLTQLLRQADGWLLAGAGTPPELPRLLDPLKPAERVTAVAYLRRIGLLEGPALDLETLLDDKRGAQ